MKVKYVESVILNLPNFNGSIPTRGGLGSKMYIQWFKTNDHSEFNGLDDNEALDLLNLLKSQLKFNVSESVIKEMEEDNLPFIPIEVGNNVIREYELSKILDYSKILDFEVMGYLPI